MSDVKQSTNAGMQAALSFDDRMSIVNSLFASKAFTKDWLREALVLFVGEPDAEPGVEVMLHEVNKQMIIGVLAKDKVLNDGKLKTVIEELDAIETYRDAVEADLEALGAEGCDELIRRMEAAGAESAIGSGNNVLDEIVPVKPRWPRH